MKEQADQPQAFPFLVDDWVVDSANPSQLGQFTGKQYPAGPHVMVELRYPDGSTKFRPLQVLRKREEASRRSVDEQLRSRTYGKLRDLQRLLTFEKLKGTLHEVIYSMEAAQVDFYPYQFKPVLKFIESPTERLVIADEVGLGKTIESMLVWLELVARRQAKRLLIVCPKILQDKWRLELRTKFMIDSHAVDAEQIAKTLSEVRESGPGVPCVFVATYSGLRPPKSELAALDGVLDDTAGVSTKARLLHDIRQWDSEVPPFDLVVFDEAHYMRNSATATFHVGEALSSSAGAVLCVSATPINNKNSDLHSLLRLIDPDFFQTQGTFDALLEANVPTVQAGNALARLPVDLAGLLEALKAMKESRYIADSPLLRELESLMDAVSRGERSAVARGQAIVEKLNLLGSYVSRTRRVQVKEARPIREPVSLKVDYSPEERRLYDAILHLVRRRCAADGRPFHVFHVLGLQLRAASCLPALAREIRAGRLGSSTEILSEAFLTDTTDDTEQEPDSSTLRLSELESLLNHDFEASDGKYAQLRTLLLEMVPDDKVVIFSFYRATLAYLRRRLSDDGIRVATIHGDMPNDERLDEIDKVRESLDRMVLLSSEVGSEGLDLQFCRVVVNYDLPWNPMRVEQRIGRIDRVGQLAKKLAVVNFKITNTIEERLYERLFQKLEKFSSSLGDLEEVVGREVAHLTVQLLTHELTAEQEGQLMDQTRQVIEQRFVQMQTLEESGDALLSLADYVQRQLEEDREKGRYVQPDELEQYVKDFFERDFPGCELAFGVPQAGCVTVRLTGEASRSLLEFIGDDRSLSAQPFRRRDVAVSFRRETVMGLPQATRRLVTFANHLSPFVRWITARHRKHSGAFHPIAAVEVTADVVPAGAFTFRIERWRFQGLATRERLAYAVSPLGHDRQVSEEAAEALLQQCLRSGTTWEYADCSEESVSAGNDRNAAFLQSVFSEAATQFDNETRTTHQIRAQRVSAVFERRLAQDEQRLKTALAAGRKPSAIKLMEDRIRKARQVRDEKLAELGRRREVDYEREAVAAGVLLVHAPA